MMLSQREEYTTYYGITGTSNLDTAALFYSSLQISAFI